MGMGSAHCAASVNSFPCHPIHVEYSKGAFVSDGAMFNPAVSSWVEAVGFRIRTEELIGQSLLSFSVGL